MHAYRLGSTKLRTPVFAVTFIPQAFCTMSLCGIRARINFVIVYVGATSLWGSEKGFSESVLKVAGSSHCRKVLIPEKFTSLVYNDAAAAYDAVSADSFWRFCEVFFLLILFFAICVL